MDFTKKKRKANRFFFQSNFLRKDIKWLDIITNEERMIETKQMKWSDTIRKEKAYPGLETYVD